MTALRPSILATSPAAGSATRERLVQLCHFAAADDGRPSALATGYEQLDALLPGGGWPLGSIIELLSAVAGIGELTLFLPALVRLAQAGRSIAWIAPPYIPYAVALAQRGLPLERILIIQTRSAQESLWATEQALRCPAIGAVLGWLDHIADRNLRRLQLAAEAGGSLGLLHRPPAAAAAPSPAAVRLQLQALADGLSIHILKARGGRAGLNWRLPRSEPSDAVAVHSFARAGA